MQSTEASSAELTVRAVNIVESPPVARATSVLCAAALALTCVYLGVIKVSGPTLGPWLGYFTRQKLRIEWLLTGGVWLFVLIELAIRGSKARSARASCFATAGATAVFAGSMLYVLRDTRHFLGDGPVLLSDPLDMVVDGGFYTYLEELAGMWLPLRIAQARHAFGVQPGAAILDGYRIVSIGSGMIYASAVAIFARHWRVPRVFATLCLGQAAMLMFAGYVENYVVAFCCLSIGFLVAVHALRAGHARPGTTLTATILFSIAVIFHAVSVWSVFSLVLLAFFALPTPSAWRTTLRVISLNTAVGLSLLVVGYLTFTLYLTPGVTTAHLAPLLDGDSELPFALTPRQMLSVRPMREHLLAVLRVAFPALCAGVAGWVARPDGFKAFFRARDVQFALTFLLGFLLHQAIWRSTLGTFRDWDLFGFSAIPLSYLGARCLDTLPASRTLQAALFACCLLGGFSWLLSQSSARWSH